MKIQQIQNNNTNFQGLHGNKRILKKLTPEILQKTGIQECADKFEVLVKGEHEDSFIHRLFRHYGKPMCQVGEDITKGKNGKFTIIKPLTYQKDISRLKDGELFEDVKWHISVWFIDQKRYNTIYRYIQEGKIDKSMFDFRQLSKILPEKEYLEYVESTLAPKYFVQDKDGNTPLHKADPQEMRDAVDILKLKPQNLLKACLIKNKEGELPIHNPSIMKSPYLQYALMENLSCYPQYIKTIFETPNKQGKTLVDSLVSITKNDSYDEYASKLLQRFAEQLNKKIDTEFNFENIMNILKVAYMQSSYGLSMNRTNNISKIVGFAINEAKPEEYKTIIEELRKIPNIDYDKTDENGISVIEHVMNAEDMNFIELLGKKPIIYRPELDYAYERIENKEFKEKIDSLLFDFRDLEKAVKLNSAEAIKLIAKSPLYKRYYNGEQLQELIYKYGNPKLEAECKDYLSKM